MSVLTCQVCGGTLTVEASGQIQCTLCGVTYTKETLQAPPPTAPKRSVGLRDHSGRRHPHRLSRGGRPGGRACPTGREAGDPAGEGSLLPQEDPPASEFARGGGGDRRMAFCKCIHLEQVTLPQTLRRIESDAFTNWPFPSVHGRSRRRHPDR